MNITIKSFKDVKLMFNEKITYDHMGSVESLYNSPQRFSHVVSDRYIIFTKYSQFKFKSLIQF
jgi:hypothetical protein